MKSAVLLSHIFPGRLGWYAYVLMPALGVLSIPWILATTYIRSTWLTPAVAMLLFTFQPRLFGEIAFITGNFGVLIHFLLFAAGIPGIRRNSWLFFYVAVIFASLVKPPFLAFLLLPLFVGREQLWKSSLTVVVAAAIYGIQMVLMPSLYYGFQHAVTTQIMVQRDAGIGICGYLIRLGSHMPFLLGLGAPAVHFILISVLICALFRYRNGRGRPSAEYLWTPAILVLAVAANPRLEVYEATMAVVPAIYICADTILSWPPGRYRTIVIAGALAAFATLLSRDAQAATCLLIFGAVLLAIIRLRAAVRLNARLLTA